jgi:hypothetical protein
MTVAKFRRDCRLVSATARRLIEIAISDRAALRGLTQLALAPVVAFLGQSAESKEDGSPMPEFPGVR